jgi:two-component system, LytTR family, response regulator
MEQLLPEDPFIQARVIKMTPSPFKSRIIIKRGVENIILKLEDILFFYTENKIVYLLDKDRVKYLYDKKLCDLEEILDPQVFFRANRKYILNINYIKSYRTYEKVKLSVECKVPDTHHYIIISQEMAPVFKKWIAGL